MTKQHFIALADAIRAHNKYENPKEHFTEQQLDTLAVFCKQQNINFDRGRWLGYIAGENDPSGGTVKKGKVK